MYDRDFETEENKILTKDKIQPQHCELSWSWIPKSLILVQKDKINLVIAFLCPPKNMKLSFFHVIFVQSPQRNVQLKTSMMHMQSHCFAY